MTKRHATHTRLDDSRIVMCIVWIIAWPFFGLIASGVALLLVATALIYLNPEGFSPRLLLFWLGVVLVGFFTWAHVRLSSKSDMRSQVSGMVLRVYTWLGAGIILFVMAVTPSQQSIQADLSDEPTVAQSSEEPQQPAQGAHSPKQNPELLSILEQIGATETNNLSIKYVDSLDNPNWTGAYYYYMREDDDSFVRGEIEILRSQPSVEALRRIVAHEYLHHVWESQINRQTRDNLTSHLISLHGRNSMMQQRVSSYVQEGTLLPTEIFAFACTEFSDYWLSSYTLEQCNSYIHRSQLQMLY